jgi:hypothetical protein
VESKRQEGQHPLGRLGGQIAPGVAVGATLLVLQTVVHQRDVWIAVGVLAVAAIVVWLGFIVRAATAEHQRTDELEKEVATQREELDRLHVLTSRVAVRVQVPPGVGVSGSALVGG